MKIFGMEKLMTRENTNTRRQTFHNVVLRYLKNKQWKLPFDTFDAWIVRQEVYEMVVKQIWARPTIDKFYITRDTAFWILWN